MSDNLHHSLSALMDNEADELELRRLLNELEEDERLCESWSRYHLVRASIRNELPSDFVDIDISGRINKTLESEPALTMGDDLSKTLPNEQSASNKIRKVWLKPLAGVAVAASVALVTVIGIRNFESESFIAPPIDALSEVDSSAVAVVRQPRTDSLVKVSGSSTGGQPIPVAGLARKVSLSENIQRARRNRLSTQQRLDAYLLQHAEHAALNNSQGMIPMARVAKFPLE